MCGDVILFYDVYDVAHLGIQLYVYRVQHRLKAKILWIVAPQLARDLCQLGIQPDLLRFEVLYEGVVEDL